MTFALPYVSVMVIFAIMAVIYAQRCDREEDQKLCMAIQIAAVGMFYIFFAFRGYLYTDWRGYAEYYNNVTWNSILEITQDKQGAVFHEPGFTLLMCLCKTFCKEFAFFSIALSTLDIILLLRFLKRWGVNNLPFVFMMFMMFNGVGIMSNLMRNQMAIFIFMNTLEYIEKKEPLKYIAGCLLAMCFHSTAVLFLPLYFFLGRKINRWIYPLIFLAFFGIYIMKFSVVLLFFELIGMGGTIGEKVKVYTEVFSEARIFSLSGTLEKFGIVFLIFVYYECLTQKVKNVIIINSLLCMYFFYYVFSEFDVLSSRLSLNFAYSCWLVWIILMEEVKLPNNKRLLGITLFLYCLYSQSVAYQLPAQEYDNFLFGAKSQHERLRIIDKTYEGIVD